MKPSAVRRSLWVPVGLALLNAVTCRALTAGDAAAGLESLKAQGDAVLTTAWGDFDGDGLQEVAVSLADPTVLGGEVEYMDRSRTGRARAARVVLLKPDGAELAPWTELPLSGGTGDEAFVFDKLAVADLVKDTRPELFVCAYQPLMGNTGEGEAYVYIYREGGFREIWRIEGQSWRWACVGHCEIARTHQGREVVVVAPAADPYHLHSTPQHFSLSAHGYRGDRYQLLSQRLTVGRYRSADEALDALGHGCRRF